jgi:hypothetical protein
VLDFCRKSGYVEWARRNLQTELRRRVPLAEPEADGGPGYMARMTRHWLPTDEEVLDELDAIERIEPRHRTGHLWKWWQDFAERGDPEGRPRRLLCKWVTRNPTSDRFVMAAKAIRQSGTRQDLEAISNLRPSGGGPEVVRVAADAAFAVRRRSLD